MSRRSVLIQNVKRNLAKQKGPHLIILPGWTSRDGEPLVTWALDHRTPTPAEIAAAVTQWKKTHAAAAAQTHRAQNTTMKPAQGSGDEEIDQ